MAARTTKPSLQLDVSRLLRHLGGAPAIRRKLAVLGFDDPPTEAQMRKWVERRMVPGSWLLVLLVQAKTERRAIDLTEFLRAA